MVRAPAADRPGAIEAAHLAYFRAGAQVATTASYQASIDGFANVGLDRAEAIRVIQSSVALADRARATFRAETGTTGTLLVAGSIGPFGAYLADGSEYRGDYLLDAEAFRVFHKPRMDALVDAGADLLAIETIPTVREAEVLVDLLDEVGRVRLAELLVPGRCPHLGRGADRGRGRAGRPPQGRRGRGQLHGATVRARPA